jgi:hypothetical protein
MAICAASPNNQMRIGATVTEYSLLVIGSLLLIPRRLKTDATDIFFAADPESARDARRRTIH